MGLVAGAFSGASSGVEAFRMDSKHVQDTLAKDMDSMNIDSCTPQMSLEDAMKKIEQLAKEKETAEKKLASEKNETQKWKRQHGFILQKMKEGGAELRVSKDSKKGKSESSRKSKAESKGEGEKKEVSEAALLEAKRVKGRRSIHLDSLMHVVKGAMCKTFDIPNGLTTTRVEGNDQNVVPSEGIFEGRMGLKHEKLDKLFAKKFDTSAVGKLSTEQEAQNKLAEENLRKYEGELKTLIEAKIKENMKFGRMVMKNKDAMIAYGEDIFDEKELYGKNTPRKYPTISLNHLPGWNVNTSMHNVVESTGLITSEPLKMVELSYKGGQKKKVTIKVRITPGNYMSVMEKDMQIPMSIDGERTQEEKKESSEQLLTPELPQKEADLKLLEKINSAENLKICPVQKLIDTAEQAPKHKDVVVRLHPEEKKGLLLSDEEKAEHGFVVVDHEEVLSMEEVVMTMEEVAKDIGMEGAEGIDISNVEKKEQEPEQVRNILK
jgi:hypothetical protein